MAISWDEFCKQYGEVRNLTPDEAKVEVEHLVGEICRKFVKRFAFGYQTPADIYQEGYAEAVKVLTAGDKYDVNRPLQPFLARHLIRRLTNLKRSKYYRHEKPCKCCDRTNPPANPCKAFLCWRENNRRKMATYSPASINSPDYEALSVWDYTAQQIDSAQFLSTLPEIARKIVEKRMDGKKDLEIRRELGLTTVEFKKWVVLAQEMYKDQL